MFIRSILIPTFLVLVIASPILFSKSNVTPVQQDFQSLNSSSQGGNPWGTSNADGISAYNGLASSPTAMNLDPFAMPSSSRRIPPNIRTVPSSDGQLQSPETMPFNPVNRIVPFGLVSNSTSNNTLINRPAYTDQFGVPQQAYPRSPGSQPLSFNSIEQTGPPSALIAPMVPDYNSAQRLIFPGNEFGPDLTAQPLEFLPVTDFADIFRFDISQNWIRSRWDRVSVNSTTDGLQGFRVALVTGTNSWDLHGSLTYFFDENQRLQRITFRGWTGDSGKLIELLSSRYQFKSQPSSLAGYFVAKKFWKTTGAVLMKYPPVIERNQPWQQLAVVLEINDPSGQRAISEDMQALIAGSIGK